MANPVCLCERGPRACSEAIENAGQGRRGNQAKLPSVSIPEMAGQPPSRELRKCLS